MFVRTNWKRVEFEQKFKSLYFCCIFLRFQKRKRKHVFLGSFSIILFLLTFLTKIEREKKLVAVLCKGFIQIKIKAKYLWMKLFDEVLRSVVQFTKIYQKEMRGNKQIGRERERARIL